MSNIKYLGETEFPIEETPYKDYTTNDWALYCIGWGSVDGAHHKSWALDQTARAVHGGIPEHFKLAKWEGGYSEWRLGEMTKTKEYLEWVREQKAGEDGPDTYSYDEGISP